RHSRLVRTIETVLRHPRRHPLRRGAYIVTNRRSNQSEAGSELAKLAAQYNLRPVGGRPGVGTYLKDLWQRRSFLWVMASSRSYGKYQNNYLGQVWSVLSPLTLAAVYYLVFGILIPRASDGVENYVGFLTIGVFIFQAFSRSEERRVGKEVGSCGAGCR